MTDTVARIPEPIPGRAAFGVDCREVPNTEGTGDLAKRQAVIPGDALGAVMGPLEAGRLPVAVPGVAQEVTLGLVLAALAPLATEAELEGVKARLDLLGTQVTLDAIVTALGPLATSAKQDTAQARLDLLATEASLVAVTALGPLATSAKQDTAQARLDLLATEASLVATQPRDVTDRAARELGRVDDMAKLIPARFDSMTLAYTGDDLTTVVYKQGLDTVATLTLGYTGGKLTSVVRT